MWSVVVAAGGGSRLGAGVPKAFVEVGGQTLMAWSVRATAGIAHGVVVVVPPGHEVAARAVVDELEDGLMDGLAMGIVAMVPGGDTRSASVRAGLAALEATGSDDDIVVVHDAARPAAGPELFASVVAGVAAGADGCIPGVPVTDSLKRVDGGRVVASVDRYNLVAVQTPQAFRLGVLRRAHAIGGDATDDAALVEAGGGTIVVVPGSPTNIKVTVAGDLPRVATELAGRSPA